MDFRLNDDHEALRKTVEDFARTVVAPRAAEMDETGEFPYDIVEQMGEMGLFGLPFPEEYDGMGGDYFALCLAFEELARVDSSVAITLEAGVSLGAMPVYRFGTEEQKREWLPQLAAGKALGAFGLTEPGGGTDAGATRTRARLDDGEWVIDGTKCFITNAGHRHHRAGHGDRGHRRGRRPQGDLLDPGAGAARRASRVAPKYSKVGWHASDTREMSFSGCRVPEANLLGERGRGYANFLSILDEGRIAIAALAVGSGAGLRRRVAEVRQGAARVRRADRAYQAIQFKIADMEMRTHTARLAYYDAAARMLRRRAVQEAGGHRQAVRVGDRGDQRPRGDADPRRLRVHERVPGGPVLAGLQDPGDRRGHVRGAADAHRARARALGQRFELPALRVVRASGR